VSQSTLDAVGAVSRECALEMASGARQAFNAQIGISSTGIAGPGGATARKPVGLIYVAAATPDRSEVRELHLDGDRLRNIHESAVAALELTLDVMRPDPS
jgi:PncC family amidohydrolase